MNTWQQRIASCIENNRQYLKGIPLHLIATIEYNPDVWYWVDYTRALNN